MMKKVLLLFIFIVFAIQVKSWFGCHNFKEIFHFSKYSVLLELDNLVHNDTGLPFVLIRFYHNKITQSAISIFSSYLRFWDIKFLVNLLLPVGIFGLVYGLLYRLKTRMVQILFLVALILPFIEIFLAPAFYFPIKIIIFSIPFLIISFFGMSTFLEGKKKNWRFLILVAIFLLSVWWKFALPTEFLNFCS